jgi:hypothetical protein
MNSGCAAGQKKAAFFSEECGFEILNLLATDGSESFGYMAGADAASADLDASDRALTDCFNLLQVRMPGAAGFVVRMADVVSEARTFAADFTNFRHDIPPEILKRHFLP